MTFDTSALTSDKRDVQQAALRLAMNEADNRAENKLYPIYSSSLDPLFWPASRAGVESAWVTHVPFAHWIVTAHRPRSLVELGTHNGVSYSAFCEAVQRAQLDCRCSAIDTWQGDEHAGYYGEEIYADLRRFHDARYGSFSELIRDTFDNALATIPDKSIDLLHIDGLHTYEAVRHDFDSWLPKCSDRAVVMLHDTNVRGRNFGVWKLWDELSQKYPSFEFMHGYGLGVLEVGTSCSDVIHELTHSSSSRKNAIRERFSYLGERWRGEMRVVELTRIRDRQLEELRQEQARQASDQQNLHEAALAQARQETVVANEQTRTAVEREQQFHQAALAQARQETVVANEQTRTAVEREQQFHQAALAAAHQQAAITNEQVRSVAEHERAEAKTRIDTLEALLNDARREAAETGGRLTLSDARLAQIETSTTWRATGPVRALGARLPAPARLYLRRLAFLTWWTVTFRLPRKIRERSARRRQIIQQPPSSQPSDQKVFAVDSSPKIVGPRTETVDIVICVHNALNSVRNCIESMLQCTMPPYRVIIVDDGSDPETASYLAKQAAEQHFQLVRNETAKGYTRAANAGLKAATAPWVVLLNSDTVVTPYWLDRMWAHGASDPKVGVIGPLSNTASWQSVPKVFDGEDWAENPLPQGTSVDDFGALVSSSAIGAVELPFINGFCYMIRGDVLKSVGIFDEATFGGGYGEENDYCIRVRKANWSLVVATDVFVYHAQSKSYSKERRLKLANRADELLAQKYDPQQDIWPQANFCRDSLAMAAARARIDAALRRREMITKGREKFEGKRIAFLLPIAERGGGGNVVIQEGLALQRMGVDVTMLNLETFQRNLGAVPEPLTVRTFPSTESMTAHLMQDSDRYDAVIATLYKSVYWLPLQAGYKLGYYVQDYEPNFFPESDPEYSASLQSYSYSEKIRLLTKTRWNQLEVFRHTGRNSALLGPSVNLDAFAPLNISRDLSRPIQITAMVRPSTPRRAPRRTVAILEEIVAVLGSHVSVKIFGTDDGQLESTGLKREWAQNLGHLTEPALAALLAETDIFVDFSDYQAMGLTALEAMVSGCAVVAPEKGGANEYIRTGVSGMLVDTADEAACVEVVLKLATDQDLLKNVRLNAVKDANRCVPENAALLLLKGMFDE